MATKNPRVVGYVSLETHAMLKKFMNDNDLTESKAINAILSEFFGTVSNTLNSISGRAPDKVLQRIATLERQVAELANALGEYVASEQEVSRKRRSQAAVKPHTKIKSWNLKKVCDRVLSNWLVSKPLESKERIK